VNHAVRLWSAGKKCAERNFGHQTNLDRVAQQIDDALAGLGFADVDFFRKVELPVTLDFDFAVFPKQPMTGLEFAN